MSDRKCSSVLHSNYLTVITLQKEGEMTEEEYTTVSGAVSHTCESEIIPPNDVS